MSRVRSMPDHPAGAAVGQLEGHPGRARGHVEDQRRRGPGRCGRPWPDATGRSDPSRGARPGGRSAAGSGVKSCWANRLGSSASTVSMAPPRVRRSHRRRSTPERSAVGSRRFDVLVVGAGPAGSIAALVLARAGAQVALLDKARFPRDKACGDFIGPRGLQVLADLGAARAARPRRRRHGRGGPDRAAGGPALLRRDHLPRPGPGGDPGGVRRRPPDRRPGGGRRPRRGPSR